MRLRVFSLIIFLSVLFILSGLFYIQIGMHERYKVMSEENRLKIVPLMAPRGTIFDAEGRALVKDVLSFNVAVIYSRIKDKEQVSEMLSSVLGFSPEEISDAIKEARRQPFTPYVIASDIGMEKAVHIEEAGGEYPGLLLDVISKREYLEGKSAANILGYLGLINRAEFERLKHYGYRLNDMVGRDGIEKYYDDYLRGTHGGKQIEVDHRGRQVDTLGYREPTRGRDVYLTINKDLQEYCSSLLKGKKGCIIAMEPVSGEVLAIASAPSYDPEIFTDSKRSDERAEVLTDEEYPLMNRAISGVYPPGSVFKTVVATAALETGAVDEHTTFYCNGFVTLGDTTFRCWRKGGHGSQDMREAIKNSCNSYFYNLGLNLGVDNIAGYAKKFGIGQKTGIDLPQEAPGILPSAEWKRQNMHEQWYRGETLNYAIGQGYLLTSPMQLARSMSVFANGGFLVKPFIVSRVGGITVNKGKREDIEISPKTIEIIREGLRECVNHPRGTGQKAKLLDVIVSGKTGTAQTSKDINHGWFAGFAPYDDPKLTVVIFDEYGGKGGYYAAGTAQDVFKKADELGLLGRGDR